VKTINAREGKHKKKKDKSKKDKYIKTKKKSSDKCKKKRKYKYSSNKSFVKDILGMDVNLDIKSKLKVNINDDTINNAINSGCELIKMYIDNKSEKK
jgi:hypothetical protein